MGPFWSETCRRIWLLCPFVHGRRPGLLPLRPWTVGAFPSSVLVGKCTLTKQVSGAAKRQERLQATTTGCSLKCWSSWGFSTSLNVIADVTKSLHALRSAYAHREVVKNGVLAYNITRVPHRHWRQSSDPAGPAWALRHRQGQDPGHPLWSHRMGAANAKLDVKIFMINASINVFGLSLA